MPFAVTHVLAPLLTLDLVKKHTKKFRKLSLDIIFAAGIGGLLPDMDVIVDIFSYLLTGTEWSVHRHFTHTLFIPLAILIVSCCVARHRPLLRALAFGWASHVFLDWLLVGAVPLAFPFMAQEWGLNLLGRGSFETTVNLLSGLDAVLFVGWIWHEERYKRILDFL